MIYWFSNKFKELIESVINIIVLSKKELFKKVIVKISLERTDTQKGIIIEVLLDSKITELVISSKFVRKKRFKLKKN